MTSTTTDPPPTHGGPGEETAARPRLRLVCRALDAETAAHEVIHTHRGTPADGHDPHPCPLDWGESA